MNLLLLSPAEESDDAAFSVRLQTSDFGRENHKTPLDLDASASKSRSKRRRARWPLGLKRLLRTSALWLPALFGPFG